MAAKRLKAVIVGCGEMGCQWVGWARQLSALEPAGLVDVNLELARQAATQHALDASIACASLSEAIERFKPDVVFDVTPPQVHHEVAIEALGKGCHVPAE